MVNYINNNIDLPKILFKNKLITDNTFTYLTSLNEYATFDLFKIVIEKEWVSNEQLIDILIKEYSFQPLTSSDRDVKIISFTKFEKFVKHGYFHYVDGKGKRHIAVNNICALPKLLERERAVSIRLVRRQEFDHLLNNSFSLLCSAKSRFYLDFVSPFATAKNISYFKIIFLFITLFSFTLSFLPIFFHLINNIIYLVQNILKIFLFKQALLQKSIDIATTPSSYPNYSILIPLYKEPAKLNAIISAIENLNYPRNKLEAKIIIEDDDQITFEKLKHVVLPDYIQVIKVPYSFPRTKPKALNYALPFIKGEYVVIYDAEDRPDPNQLILAVKNFNNLPKEYACLQSRLNFYNDKENLLSSFFSLEYSMWFDYLLKGLYLYNLPITLGGTSNHFRVEILRAIGMWDAYNVTEDADLGLRLYMQGYKVKMIDSLTLEEAPIEIKNWVGQRARWIKGYLQTLLVYLKSEKELSTKLTLTQRLSVYVFVGLSTYSFFCLPWLIFIVIINKNIWVSYVWLVNMFFAFCYLYGAAYLILSIKYGNIRNFAKQDYLVLILFPLYFVLHTIASYRALYEVILEPFKWNKTEHGVSKEPIKQDQ